MLVFFKFFHPQPQTESASSTSTKSRRSSCDTPDQPVTSSFSTTTTSGGEVDDDFDSLSTIKYKLIAGGAGNLPRTPTTGTPGNINNCNITSPPATKTQVNIITNPLVRQYPFETNYKTKKMYANETIVTHQPGGNLKTISYGNSISATATTAVTATGIDMKRSPLLNRRRSSSVTLPQPPMTADRYRDNSNHFDTGGTTTDGRNSR